MTSPRGSGFVSTTADVKVFPQRLTWRINYAAWDQELPKETIWRNSVEPNRRKWSLHRLAQLRETVLDSRGGFGEAMAADWGLAGDARTEFLNRSDRRHGVASSSPFFPAASLSRLTRVSMQRTAQTPTAGALPCRKRRSDLYPRGHSTEPLGQSCPD
jgi:hypothetical protein